MKKLNEGPTIQKNHKGNHLTNADGEIVQSFGKDRAGLKAARQAMYKNYKGLNVKKPEPEPQEEPVEEGNIHDDMALMKKQHNASVDAGNDPRLQHARGEKLWRQQHKANRGVDMPADAFNASDSRKVLDMDYDDKFGKYDWDKPVEFAKPDARALALNKQAKAARANFKSNKLPPLTQTQRDTYKQSRNTQTAQANKQRVANGMKPFALEDAITEEFGETFTVHPSRVSQKGHYKVFYSIHDQLKVAQITRWATKNKITIQKYDTNKIIIHGSASDHRNMVRYLRNEGIRGDATVMNPTITSKDQSIHSGDADIRQTYDFDSDGHFVTDRGEEDIGHGVSARIQQKIQQDRLMNNEDRKMSDLENKLKEQLEEGITVNTTSTNDDNVEDSVTVTAQGADAMELMNMLKMAGIGGQAEAPVPVDEIPSEDEGCGCGDVDDIDSMRDMIGTMDNINVEVVALDEPVEEEAELANAPDEKYADTDVLVNKISGGLNRRKKQYRKEYPGDNPMAVEGDESDNKVINNKPLDEFSLEELTAEKDRLELKIKAFPTSSTDEHRSRLQTVINLINDYSNDNDIEEESKNESVQVTESEEELTARFLKEYDEFKVTAPEDSDEGDWEIENVGKWAVKIGKNAPEPEMALDAEIAGLGDGFSGIIDTELAGVLADEAVEEGLVEDDVEEGLRIVRKVDNKCIGGHCDDGDKISKPTDDDSDDDSEDDALDKVMSESKKKVTEKFI